MSKGVPLPMIGPGALGPDGLVPCTSCAKCCTYVAVGVNAPTNLRRATEVLWYLYHEGVDVYRDAAGEWSVVFEARCRNLRPDLLCGIYEKRPHICRAFDHVHCEVNSPDGGTGFKAPAEFLEWLKAKRPRLYEKLARTHVPEPLLAPGPAPARPARRRR